MRIRRNWPTGGFSPQGWSGVPDEAPAWTATIVASWKPPTVDWGQVLAGIAVAGFLAAAALGLWRDREGFGFLIPTALALFFGWTALRHLRGRQPATELTLTLGPDALRLSSSAASVLPVDLSRDRAGWLIAEEIATNWHWRRLTLLDVADRPVARFIGSLATVRVQSPGVPASATVPDRVPTAVLLGAWWPHPARRMTVQGSMSVRLRWREPDLVRFPGHERRARVLWSALYGAFALLCLAVAVIGPGAVWTRLAFGAAGIGLLVWRALVLRWRPTFVR